MSRWHNRDGQPVLLSKKRRKGGPLRQLYDSMNYFTAEEAQAAVAAGPSPTREWEATQAASVEATKKQFLRDNDLPEVSYEEREQREAAARAAEEREELRRASQAARRHQADLDHSDRVARLLQRRGELEAVKAFEERYIEAPRKLARFVRGGGR